jgi:hypothetical protein
MLALVLAAALEQDSVSLNRKKGIPPEGDF